MHAYDCIAESIAAFERTALFAQFSSKYDYYLSKCIANGGILDDCAKGNGRVAARVGRKIFSWMQWKGFQLFMNDNNNNDGIKQPGEGAMCVACHTADFTDPDRYKTLSQSGCCPGLVQGNGASAVYRLYV